MTENRLLIDKLSYNRETLREESEKLSRKLTDEQRNVYEIVIDETISSHGGLFYVYCYGGTRKTFVWRALYSSLYSKGDIFINVVSSGIASLLLPGGKTACTLYVCYTNFFH